MENVRIDKGVKRGPKIKIKPSALETQVRAQTRNSSGKFLPIHNKEERDAIVKQCVDMLSKGYTTNDIGEQLGVTGQAVRSWLVAIPEADIARTLFFSSIQVKYADEMEVASDPLALARVREAFRAWNIIAKARDPNFVEKQEVNMTVSLDLGDKLRLARERAEAIERDVTPQQIPESLQIIDGQASSS